MKRNLVIYEDYKENKKYAGVFGRIIGNCKLRLMGSVDINTSQYNNVIIIGSETAKEEYGKFIEISKEKLEGKGLYLIGIGSSAESFNKFSSIINEKLGMSLNYSVFLKEESVDGADFSKTVYDTAFKIRDMIYGRTDDISTGEVLEAVKEYLNNNNTCTLGTGADGYVRCTPIEYTYMNGVFYLITEGGMKFYGILQNKNVSLAVYDKYEGMGGKLKGLQVQGTAQIIEKGTDEYYRIMEVKGVKKDVVEKLPIDMNVIKIVPSKYEFLNSDFKKSGADTKQTVNMLNK